MDAMGIWDTHRRATSIKEVVEGHVDGQPCNIGATRSNFRSEKFDDNSSNKRHHGLSLDTRTRRELEDIF
jgi:hypothetical protein